MGGRGFKSDNYYEISGDFDGKSFYLYVPILTAVIIFGIETILDVG